MPDNNAPIYVSASLGKKEDDNGEYQYSAE